MQSAPRARTPKLLAYDQRKPRESELCSLPSNGGAKWTRQMKRGESPARVQMVRDILTKEHRQQKPSGSVANRMNQRTKSEPSFCRSFSYLACIGWEDCRKCKKRSRTSRNAHLAKRVLDIGGTNKPVSSVFKRSLNFNMGEQRSRRRVQKNDGCCYGHR